MTIAHQRFDRWLPLLALLFIVDLIAVFKGFWWRDTYRSIYWSLILITIISTIFPRRHLLLRIPVDLFLGICVTFRVSWHRQPEIVEHFSERVVVAYPFLKITLCVILILILIERLAVTKQRLAIIFTIGLLILTIRDSFSPLRLWMNIACLVILFLVWHTLLHYRSIDNSTLSKLLKRPFALVTPVIAVLLSITLIGFSLPHGPPLLEDPYALWKKSRGESIPAFIGDKGYANSSGSGLLSTSGYSRDSSQLGGGFNYDYTPVMKVETSQKGYLRGESKAVYDGSGWSDLPELKVFEAIQVGKPLSLRYEPNATYVDVAQHVKFLDQRSFPVLFANGFISSFDQVFFNMNRENKDEESQLQALQPGEHLTGYVWEHDSLAVLSLPLEEAVPVAEYTVSTQSLIIDTERLKSASSTIDAFWYDIDVYDVYVEVPETVPTRVYELAEQVTAAGKNDYERALLLENHMRMHYMYTNTPDLSLMTGQSEDFVDQFLFELREGYCDYFSTAMVVMARTLGMPARWVKGYTAGINEAELQMINSNPFLQEEWEPSQSGTFTIRNADAHSWVEIHFEGIGWVSFEPTPGFSIPQQYNSEELEATLEELLPSFEPLEDTMVEVADSDAWLTAAQRRLVLWSSTSLLLVLLAGFMLYYRKQLAVNWRNLRYLSFSTNEKIVEETNALIKRGKRRGLPGGHTMTMRETLLAWKTYYPHVSNELDELLLLFESANYSNTFMTEHQAERVRVLSEVIKKQWKK